MRTTRPWSSTARRVGSSTIQPTSAWTCEPSSSQLHGRMTSPGPISSTQRRPEDVDVAAQQPVDDEEAAVVDVGLARDVDVPFAGRELLHARERVAARALELVGVEQLGEVGIGVDEADDVAPHGRVLPIAGHVGSLTSAPEPRDGRAAARRLYLRRPHRPKESSMLWLILGIVLLIIAIAGGVIVHPILFALAILALVVFFAGSRGRAV